MQVKRFQVSNSNQRGFTFIELVIVVGILSLLATIAIGEFYHNRKKAFDQQAIAVTKNLLNMAATAFASSENPAVQGPAVGTFPPGYPELEVNENIHIDISLDADDAWSFYVASAAGDTAYFFWLPGDHCVINTVGGYPSDYIVDDPAWRAAVFGL